MYFYIELLTVKVFNYNSIYMQRQNLGKNSEIIQFINGHFKNQLKYCDIKSIRELRKLVSFYVILKHYFCLYTQSSS